MARWVAVLDDLERQSARLEAELDDDRGELPARAFTPPAELGTMPSELTGRARALQERQRALIDRLEQAQTANGRHLQVTRELGDRGPAGPIYIDTTG